MVDSNDRERVAEAREELQRMLNEDELRDAVLLVFANKQDLPNAMNPTEITDKLGLQSIRQRQWFIQATCATSGDGLFEGLEWLSSQLKRKMWYSELYLRFLNFSLKTGPGNSIKIGFNNRFLVSLPKKFIRNVGGCDEDCPKRYRTQGDIKGKPWK